ncbi:MAG: bifunctional hydroxymethylpyrimidine kinase/phosphomethylpyrimidine kinase [Deltaproteobacteria bacterium]|nr:bifunctional hydroxymethylpyrimidine kinase/phosphomethylpyrimidine kinase [Deltaproteobacteria bacterium]MBI3016438.1 bifunctional hydroxymethylpyrimidine kinase/phosphomethylpyrimidine kinase [Deltaproteobacteria bacterium]
MSIVVVGTTAFDSVQTPYGAAEKVLGGSANYFSMAASFFTPIKMVSVIGEDFPQDHLEYLNNRNVCTKGIAKLLGKTFHWKGQYERDLSEAETLETHLNVLEQFKPALPHEYRKCEYVFLANIDPDLQQQVLEQMESPKVVACDTMNFWISLKRESLIQTLKRIDIFLLNEAEARQLSGESNLIRAAKKIHACGPRIIIIKRGEHGALLYNEGRIFVLSAFPLETVQDPTGAGDTFAGGFMGYLAKSQNELDDTTLRKAIVYGTVMASFNVEDFSFNRLKTLDWGLIEQRYRSLLNALSF